MNPVPSGCGGGSVFFVSTEKNMAFDNDNDNDDDNDNDNDNDNDDKDLNELSRDILSHFAHAHKFLSSENTKEIIINLEEIRLVKDGED